MGSLLPEMVRYGVPLLAGVAFLEALGLPLPASLALLVAGASAAHGSLRTDVALTGGIGCDAVRR